MRPPAPLIVISSVFAASIALRAGDVAAKFAAERETVPSGSGVANPEAKSAPDASNAAAAPLNERRFGQEAACNTPVLLAAVRERESELERRAGEIADREAELKIIERRVQERIAQLSEAKARLDETVRIAETAKSEDIDRLVRMYQAMKPKEAGEIFNAMEATFAAGFLASMRPDAAALILSNMDADKAYAVSLIIAGRNARTPER